MTCLINQLVDMDIVVGYHDTNDRRVANISFTTHGKWVLEECKNEVKNIIKGKLSCLTPSELAGLSLVLEKLKGIDAKLE